jgi:hypothetical protein
MWKKNAKKFNAVGIRTPEADTLSTDFWMRLTFRLTLVRYNFLSIRDINLKFCVVVYSNPANIFNTSDIRLTINFLK